MSSQSQSFGFLFLVRLHTWLVLQPGHNAFVLHSCLLVFPLLCTQNTLWFLKQCTIRLKWHVWIHISVHDISATLKYWVPFSLTMALCSSFSVVFISQDSLACVREHSILVSYPLMTMTVYGHYCLNDHLQTDLKLILKHDSFFK